MHGLDVIIARNETAAGRECAHAMNDGDGGLAMHILDASGPEKGRATSQFLAGYRAGQQER